MSELLKTMQGLDEKFKIANDLGVENVILLKSEWEILKQNILCPADDTFPDMCESCLCFAYEPEKIKEIKMYVNSNNQEMNLCPTCANAFSDYKLKD